MRRLLLAALLAVGCEDYTVRFPSGQVQIVVVKKDGRIEIRNGDQVPLERGHVYVERTFAEDQRITLNERHSYGLSYNGPAEYDATLTEKDREYIRSRGWKLPEEFHNHVCDDGKSHKLSECEEHWRSHGWGWGTVAPEDARPCGHEIVR